MKSKKKTFSQAACVINREYLFNSLRAGWQNICLSLSINRSDLQNAHDASHFFN
jgi:hypothetical protein